MKDFFEKAKNAGLAAANITAMLAMSAAYEVKRGADSVVRRVKGTDNGMTADVAATTLVPVAGFENKIVIPALSKQDKKWAKRMKSANSYEIAEELKDACMKGDNARVLHLINQPWRGGALFSRMSYGFDHVNSMALDGALHVAAGANNVGALYLLLRFVEKNDRNLDEIALQYRAEYLEERVVTNAFRALRSSGQHNAVDTTLFLADVIGDFSKAYRDSGECRDHYLAEAVQDLIRHKNTALLDVLLDKGTQAKTFESAILMTFRNEFLDRYKVVTDDARDVFLAWAQKRGVLNDVVVADVRTKMAAENEAIAAAKASGVYYLPVDGGQRYIRSETDDLLNDDVIQYSRIDEEKVVATLTTNRRADSIAVEFNFVSKKAKVDGKECTFDDFCWTNPKGGHMLSIAEGDWKEHQTLRRRLTPPRARTRAKVVKPDNNT